MTKTASNEALASASARFVTGLLFSLVMALVHAVPVMLLTDFLHGYGSPLAPLSYWQSWWVAFLLAWVIDGAGSVRRTMRSEA